MGRETMTALEIARLYDARRDCFYVRPVLRGWLHALSFVAAVVLGILLIVNAGGAARLVSAGIYAVSVAGLFGASAVYHRGRWTAVVSARLQRLDHVMIVVLIAGTATPPMMLCLTGSLRVAALVLLWSLAGAAVLVRLMWMSAPEKLVGSIYLGLGWIAGVALPAVWIRSGVGPAVLLLAGGVLYTVGALGYHRRLPDPRPSVFGYHEVFHACVSLAAACQYVAIGCFLV
jgi:hemolysin III